MKRIFASLTIVAVALGAWAASTAQAQCGGGCAGCPAVVAMTADQAEHHAGPNAEQPAEKSNAKEPVFLGNAKCPIRGGKSNPKLSVDYSDPKTHTYAKIHICCPGCAEGVKKDLAAAYKKAYLDRELKDKDGKVIAKKGEPLDLKNETCPVMGGKVAPGQYVVYNGYKIGLCCPGCEQTVVKSPDKYLAKLVKPQSAAAEKVEKPAASDAPAPKSPPRAPTTARRG